MLAEVTIPGVVEAGLGEGSFRLGMPAELTGGFAAALPMNPILVKNGIRHRHRTAPLSGTKTGTAPTKTPA